MIKAKQKPCKGTGRAKGFGCGLLVYPKRFGLGICCYSKWLCESDEGKKLLGKSILYSKKKTDLVKKHELKEKKRELLTHGQVEGILQSIINTIIRLIDIDRGCISCDHGWDTNKTRQMHAGHRLSVGSNSTLRFNAYNIFLQCSICNNYLSGNERNFDLGIIKHWGAEYINKLESEKQKYQGLKLSIQDLNEAIARATKVRKAILKGKYFGRDQINEMIGIYK
jgi:hypothetical protein